MYDQVRLWQAACRRHVEF